MKTLNKTLMAVAMVSMMGFSASASANGTSDGNHDNGRPGNPHDNGWHGRPSEGSTPEVPGGNNYGGSAKQGQMQGQMQGQSQSSVNNNTNNNTNLNFTSSNSSSESSSRSNSSSSSRAEGGDASSNAEGGDASSSGNNTEVTFNEASGVNYSGSYTVKMKNTPDVVGSALTTSNGTCMGSSSAGGSAPGIGLSFGTTWTDKECTARYNAEIMHNMGYKEVSLQIMCQLDDVAAAAGDLCKKDTKEVATRGTRPDGVIVSVPVKSNTPTSSYSASNGFF